MTRLRMVGDAIAALLSATTRTRRRHTATNHRQYLLLADLLIAADQRTNGDKP